ncbi:MAG: antitoxin [Iamia sp.]
MRTTVTLDADTEQILRRRMRERGVTFKAALNEAIRAGSRAPDGGSAFRTKTASMGTSQVNLDRALQVVAELEDDELLRKARAGQ